MCSIPASAKTGASLPEHFAVGRRSRKGPTEATALGIWAPENNSNIEAPPDCLVKNIEQRALAIRHSEIGRIKRYREPKTVLRLANCLTDPPKSRNTVDEGTNRVSDADGI